MTEAEIRKLQSQYPTENDPLPFARALIAQARNKALDEAIVALEEMSDLPPDNINYVGVIRDLKWPVCRKCNTPMQPSKAIEQTWREGLPDFIGGKKLETIRTMHAGGPGKLVDCMKCPACGWSTT